MYSFSKLPTCLLHLEGREPPVAVRSRTQYPGASAGSDSGGLTTKQRKRPLHMAHGTKLMKVLPWGSRVNHRIHDAQQIVA